jgi:hypothetical protein
MTRRLALAALVWLALAPAASAHEGPPYAMVVDRPVGPFVVSVWGDPDVGTGTFFVTIEAPGGAVPDDLSVEVAVRPASGRLAEASYAAAREPLSGVVQYKAEVAFDAQELWHIRVAVRSAAGGGDVETDAEVTPPGLGRWDLLLYFLPFLAVGVLWVRAALRKRGK